MDEAEALARARTGDAEAFRSLVECHGRTLYRAAFRLTGSEADAEDVVQETLLRAYSRLDQFEERSALRSWLYRMAVNGAYDVLRARRRRESAWPVKVDADGDEAEPFEPETEDPGPDRLAFASEVRARVRGAMDRMSAQERAAFVMRHLEGQSLKEIGDVLGQSENATKQSLFRAVRKLRTVLETAGVKA
jgi:RNA polymerase sigma-70 factor (ECF subfamily)